MARITVVFSIYSNHSDLLYEDGRLCVSKAEDL